MQPCHVVYTDFRPTPLQHYIYPAGGEGLFLVQDEKVGDKEIDAQNIIRLIIIHNFCSCTCVKTAWKILGLSTGIQTLTRGDKQQGAKITWPV